MQHFRHYSIDAIAFSLGDNPRILTEYDHHGPVAHAELSIKEWHYIDLLLRWYPDACPYTHHLQVVRGWSMEDCISTYNRACTARTLTGLLKPIVDLTAFLRREKLKDFSIDIVPVTYIGYVIILKSQRRSSAA